MSFDWPYYDLVNGWIVNERRRRAFRDQPRQFATTAEAEAWLVEMDYRGNMR